MKKTMRGVACGAVIALGAAACGESSGQMGGGSPSATTTTTMEVTPPQPYGEVIGGRVIINIHDLEFQPDRVKVPSGTTAIFTNNDKVPHTVTKISGPGPDFNSGPIEPGGTTQQSFEEPGTVRIEDEESSDTKLTIEVEKEN
jgi:plastocyanin